MADIFDIPIDIWENHISSYVQAKLKLTSKHFGIIKHTYREVNKDTIMNIIETNDYPSILKYKGNDFENVKEMISIINYSLKCKTKNITLLLLEKFANPRAFNINPSNVQIVERLILHDIIIDDDPYIISKMHIIPSITNTFELFDTIFLNRVFNYIELRGNDMPLIPPIVGRINEQTIWNCLYYYKHNSRINFLYDESGINFIRRMCKFGFAKTFTNFSMPDHVIKKLSKYFVSLKQILGSINKGILPVIRNEHVAIRDMSCDDFLSNIDELHTKGVLTKNELDGLRLLVLGNFW